MLAFLFKTVNSYFFSGIIGSPLANNRFQIIPGDLCHINQFLAAHNIKFQTTLSSCHSSSNSTDILGAGHTQSMI